MTIEKLFPLHTKAINFINKFLVNPRKELQKRLAELTEIKLYLTITVFSTNLFLKPI